MSTKNLGLSLLSDIVTFDKQARFDSTKGRREVWSEVCDRYETMMIDRFPKLADEIRHNMTYVREGKILPSMRGLQFAGDAIRTKESRIFNCSAALITEFRTISELFFNLLCGTGTGYSVQWRHVKQLPTIKAWRGSHSYQIPDTIEGWCDAVLHLLESAAEGDSEPHFQYHLIRPEGAPLKTTGGRAPGAAPLRTALDSIKEVLRKAEGRQLRPFEVHEIMCFLADAVYAGGVRRAAMISFFDHDDPEMLFCKFGDTWRAEKPHLERCNNSAVFHLVDHTYGQYRILWDIVRRSPAGCPGIFFTRCYDTIANPCVEASLRNMTFCNLTTASARGVTSQAEFNRRAVAQAFFGTLQASFTDFTYLSKGWKEATEEDALLGCSMTGVGVGTLETIDLREGALLMKETNRELSARIGIRHAARIGLIKPEGTSSLRLGVPFSLSGWWSRYFLRRIVQKQTSPLVAHLRHHAPHLLEDKINGDGTASKTDIYITVPVSVADEPGFVRDEESGLQMMKRILRYYNDWILPTHDRGENHHTVSCTVYLDKEEWDEGREWLWENRHTVRAMSVYAKWGGTIHGQTPYQTISKEEFEERSALLTPIDFRSVIETADTTELRQTIACAGGVCDV